MASATRFEDLIAWQKARALTKIVYETTPRDPCVKDFGLTGQIQRASVSVMSNIAEGFERGNPGDYHRFLAIAKASCGEVRSQLYVALDIGYVNQSEFTQLIAQTHEVSKIIGGLMFAVSKNRRGES